MNNKIMQLMGRNEWDTPNVRRACKGAFEPQDRLQKEARQKRAKADKPFYNLLKDYRSMAFNLESKLEDTTSRSGTWEHIANHWAEKCEELEEEAKKQKKQIKYQQTRIRNLKKQ